MLRQWAKGKNPRHYRKKNGIGFSCHKIITIKWVDRFFVSFILVWTLSLDRRTRSVWSNLIWSSEISGWWKMDFSVWCVGWARPVDRSKADFYHFMWSNVENRKSLTSLTDCTKNVYGATHSSRGIGFSPRTLNCLKTIDQRLLNKM